MARGHRRLEIVDIALQRFRIAIGDGSRAGRALERFDNAVAHEAFGELGKFGEITNRQ